MYRYPSVQPAHPRCVVDGLRSGSRPPAVYPGPLVALGVYAPNIARRRYEIVTLMRSVNERTVLPIEAFANVERWG